jgi:hypothetical protein
MTEAIILAFLVKVLNRRNCQCYEFRIRSILSKFRIIEPPPPLIIHTKAFYEVIGSNYV